MFAEMTWLWFDGCMTRPLTVEVPDSDRVLLETRVAGATTPRRDWQRAMIVLMAAQGVASPKIAAKVGINRNQVDVWCHAPVERDRGCASCLGPAGRVVEVGGVMIVGVAGWRQDVA